MQVTLIMIVAGFLCLLLGCTSSDRRVGDIPRLQKHGVATQFVVDREPFLMLAGELHNSGGSSIEYMKFAWPRLKAIHLNTVILPVSWELIEPDEGEFDFSVVDGLIREAKAHDLRLVLLWFGSWKNGLSSYQPLWVKTDPTRFPLAYDSAGTPKDILSTFGEETCRADARAFAALMRHVRDVDTSQTVIAVQVQNEVGMREDSRDRSPQANAAFNGPVPEQLITLLTQGGDNVVPELRAHWNAAGAKRSGTWTEVFGASLATDELFMAWHYARFIENVTAAGKAQHPIPMFANCWLDQPGTPRPGDYPSGGPLAHLLNVWQIAAPSLDFLAPDLYVPEFEYRCRLFTRAGNPLMIPETNTGDRAGPNAIFAFARYKAIGFSPFGIDGFISEMGMGPLGVAEPVVSTSPTSQAMAYAALSKIAPLILQAQCTDAITGVLMGPGAEDETAARKTIQLNGYTLTLTPRRAWGSTQPAAAPLSTLAGLFIAVGPDEFVILTTGLDVEFKRDDTPGTTTVASIDEGEIVNGRWVRGRRYNGDQTDHNRAPTRAMLPYRVLRIKLFQRP